MSYTIPFSQIGNQDVPVVGGKNASLGEMFNTLTSQGVRVPDGFAVTADAYRAFLAHNSLQEKLQNLLAGLDHHNLDNLAETGSACRELVAGGTMPESVASDIKAAYSNLQGMGNGSVAVRSSATAEDLPTASFAGQHESFLNITGIDALLQAVLSCYVSLFNDRAIKYREDNGFEHMQVALSVGVQRMVRADAGSAGVAFTLEPETGNDNFIYITAAWGLGENIVQGAVSPDEFFLFKPAIDAGLHPIVQKKIGSRNSAWSMPVAVNGRSGISRPLPGKDPHGPWRNRISQRWAPGAGQSSSIRACPWTLNGPKTALPVNCSSCRPGRKQCTGSNRN
jgi:pyruvate,water dikinase